MQILFSGHLDSLFNVNGCSHVTCNREHKQVFVFGFGYSSSQLVHVNIPLPPGNQLYFLREVPGEFFDRMEGCFTAPREVLYRHKLQYMKPCEMLWEEHESGRFRYVSFLLPIGEYRFGPIAMFMPCPKPGAVWLPQTHDRGMCSYVVSPSGTKPVGRWTKSPHELALTTQAEKLGLVLDMSCHAWRHADNPPAVVEFATNTSTSEFKTRRGN